MNADKTPKPTPFQPDFNRSIHVLPAKQPLSSDGGAILLRDFESRLGCIDDLAARLVDPRNPLFCTYTLAALIRTRLLLIGLGYQDQNDADALRHDPAMAVAASSSRGVGVLNQALASQPTMSRLIDILSSHHNRRVLMEAPLDLACKAFPLRRDHRHRYLTLDLDSTDLETHGHQQGANYNGHYEHTCYHPLIATVYETEDLVGAWLRKGNASSQRGAAEFALPIVERLEREMGQVVDVRGDAAFAVPRFMDALDNRNVKYVFRLKRNKVLNRLAKPFLIRPVGRPPKHQREWYYDLTYQAESWKAARRVVLVVVDDPERRYMGQLNLHYFFLVTTHDASLMSAETLLDFYRKRGTMETWIGELKRDVAPRLSSPTLAENQATFGLFALAYQLLHLARTFTDSVETRDARSSIATFRLRLLKVAAVFIHTGRHVVMRTVCRAHAVWTAAVARLQSRLDRLAAPPPAPVPCPTRT